MLLIDNDDANLRKRNKQGGSGADDDIHIMRDQILEEILIGLKFQHMAIGIDIETVHESQSVIFISESFRIKLSHLFYAVAAQGFHKSYTGINSIFF